ncbi:MAG: hypothetical protein WBK28_02660 [Minisyncoccia bacterium]
MARKGGPESDSHERKLKELKRAGLLASRKQKEPTQQRGGGLWSPGKPKEARMTRRALLGAGTLAVGTAAFTAYEFFGKAEGENTFSTSGEESFPAGSFQERHAQQRESFTTYRPNFIFLLNEAYQPVGDPIPVSNVTGSLSPGVAELGEASAEAVHPEWLAREYRRASIPMPPEKAERALCRIEALTFIELITHYGASVEKGRAMGIDTSLLRYVRDHIKKVTEDVDDRWTSDRLVSAVPALLGIESNFDNRAVSPTGAEGIVQYTDASWRDIWRTILKRTPDPRSFKDQLDFLGAHLTDSYKSFSHAPRVRDALSWISKNVFESEDRCKKFFEFPSLLTTYNRGTSVMVDVLEWFATECQKVQDGKASTLGDITFQKLRELAQSSQPELFWLMVCKANGPIRGFGDEGNGYAIKILALEEPLANVSAP